MRVDWVQGRRACEARRVEWLGALPSGESAEALVGGDLSALPVVTFHTGLRAGLIGLGLYAVGFRGEQLVKGAIAGAIGIEAFVLAWALYERSKK